MWLGCVCWCRALVSLTALFVGAILVVWLAFLVALTPLAQTPTVQSFLQLLWYLLTEGGACMGHVWIDIKNTLIACAVSFGMPLHLGNLIIWAVCDVAFQVPHAVRAALVNRYLFFGTLLRVSTHPYTQRARSYILACVYGRYCYVRWVHTGVSGLQLPVYLHVHRVVSGADPLGRRPADHPVGRLLPGVHLCPQTPLLPLGRRQHPHTVGTPVDQITFQGMPAAGCFLWMRSLCDCVLCVGVAQLAGCPLDRHLRGLLPAPLAAAGHLPRPIASADLQMVEHTALPRPLAARHRHAKHPPGHTQHHSHHPPAQR